MSDTIVSFGFPDSDESWAAFQELMDEQAEAFNRETKELAKQLDVPETLASDIQYLRTRSRHTYQTEERMIRCYRATGCDDFHACAGEESEVLEAKGF